MNYRTAMTPLGALALILAAFVGFAGPSNAATTPTATFHGHCRNWSVTFGSGDTAGRFDVDSGNLGDLVISETLTPGDVDTFATSFRRDGHAKIGIVYVDGRIIGAHIFACGSRR